MSILVDTNVLLRRTQPDHPSHSVAVQSVAKLIAADERIYFTLQVMSEFWNVATRPIANNGLGFSALTAFTELQKIERFLSILPDFPEGLYRMETFGHPAWRVGEQGARCQVGRR